MQETVGEILYSREVIDERVKELAAQIMAVYREKPLTVAVVLRGAFVFAADLVRHLGQQCEIVFVRASSYGDGSRPKGRVKVELPRDVKWSGRHVLVVEDIVDTGRSMKALVGAITRKRAASVRVCAFLDKPARREVPIDVEFTGFVIDGAPFVVGYGLDFAGRHRNLPFIGTVKPPRSPRKKR